MCRLGAARAWISSANQSSPHVCMQGSKSLAKRQREEHTKTEAQKAAKKLRQDMKQRGHSVNEITLKPLVICSATHWRLSMELPAASHIRAVHDRLSPRKARTQSTMLWRSCY